ncbi:hypothetical protein HMPREF9700_01058 [Bergeyella zoohelcum CCUG 30536]|uniref:Uncharacterized protein n=1 Tax=Bergeyella zoohelcum TaxID=1015 RepID=A0A380ZZT0_9FLAO|nr:hypothetical protein HMPREF9700_01058 [Bergeyella zoohelcum CCUG 30536]SUV53080.1 Uncharacterised protein [Bergeyella zoohelcum]
MTQGSILITEQNPFSSKEMAKVIGVRKKHKKPF